MVRKRDARPLQPVSITLSFPTAKSITGLRERRADNYDYDPRGDTNWIHHYRLSPYQNYSARSYWRDNRDRIVAWQKSTDKTVNPMEDGRGNHYYYDADAQLTDPYYGALDPAGNLNSW
ncbi:MAG: hypothetical protein QOJ87_2367 [Verrucomicrobiota bacterium]